MPPLALPADDAETFVRAHLRHNVTALGADFGLFLVGLSFASQSTILPAFAVHLGAPNVVIGAIPAVMTVGWFLPSLFVAAHTESLPRRLPFVLRYTLWERVPFLLLALAAFVLADRAPALALAVLLASLLVIAGVGGLLMPAWMDVVGRAVPTVFRGRFFAMVTALSSAAALGGSFLTAWVLGAVRAPISYGVCFLIAAVFMGLSYVALLAVREPPGSVVAAPRTLRGYLRGIPGLLRRDRNFSWYLGARAFALCGGMGSAFFTVYALGRYDAAPWQVGYFTTLLYAGQIAGTLALGWIADRVGHRLVILLGVAAMLVANAVALAAPDVLVFSTVFVLAGVAQAAVSVSNLNILLEFAPTPDERPTYIGLGNTALGPVAFTAPLLAGLVADGAGFPAVFAAAVVGGVVAGAILVACVREPRRRAV
ncbi:MAG: MFS transporter [Candidatus Rokubacteria bacterium]|nr:MFS transporter [Candidatus Rokubacteria bacterium]